MTAPSGANDDCGRPNGFVCRTPPTKSSFDEGLYDSGFLSPQTLVRFKTDNPCYFHGSATNHLELLICVGCLISTQRYYRRMLSVTETVWLPTLCITEKFLYYMWLITFTLDNLKNEYNHKNEDNLIMTLKIKTPPRMKRTSKMKTTSKMKNSLLFSFVFKVHPI